MYLVDRQSNKIQNIGKSTFTALGFKERQHLQEWIVGNPESLGEELLIIQKEFSGFNDTNERLDLLAMDKNGNLVIIENKLDDTGKDVTWQALKYASYCSTLTKEQIRSIYQQYLDKLGHGDDAASRLSEFFDLTDYHELQLNSPQSQRLILVAAHFRKEVTSTFLWLLAHKLKIQCYKVTPYALNEQTLLSIEQIIPLKDTEEYVINMVDKTQEEIVNQQIVKEIHQLRFEFWNLPLAKIKGRSVIFQNTNPTKDHWLSAGGTGISGLSYSFVVTKSYASVELGISKSKMEENKLIFDELYKYKDSIESKFGDTLSWQRLDNKKMCRVAYFKEGVNIFIKEEWPVISEFLASKMIMLEEAMREPLKQIKQILYFEGDFES